jgi:glycerate-2-kinase
VIIKNRDTLISHGDREGRALALEILEAGLVAADPYANTLKLLRIDGDLLHVGGDPSKDVSGYGDETIDLREIEHIYVIGAGKAVQRLALALEDLLGDRLTDGAIVVKHGEERYLQRISVTMAAHPVPDEQSVAGARKLVEIADRAGPNDLVITVFSDGASSLCCLPAPGLTLEDVRQVYFLAIKYGSQGIIHQAMRYISAVKCGRIMQHVHPARSINLIMQVGLFPRWNGVLSETGNWVPSWPPPPQCMGEAVRALQRQPWWDELTPALQRVFQSATAAHKVPAIDAFRRVPACYWQPIDCYQMVEGARAKAEELGLQGVTLSAWLTAQSSAAANVLTHIAYECAAYSRPFAPPVALITGGHLDVPTGDATGIGGRNQEFSLCAAPALGGGRLASPPPPGGAQVVVAALDSDGTDGPGTQHKSLGEGQEPFCMAGGIVDGYTMQEAAERGVDVAAELANHNSTFALLDLDSAIYTGNTGMCLGDLRVLVVH